MNQIDTSRLALLPLRRVHAAGLFAALRPPEVYRFIAQIPPATVGELEARYARLEARRSPGGEELWLNWAVEERCSGVLVGLIEVTVQKAQRALLAFLFSPGVWGKGYATEACSRIVRELFDRLEVRMIEATTDAQNVRSRRLLERLRFQLVEERESEDLIAGQKSREVLYRIANQPEPAIAWGPPEPAAPPGAVPV